MDDVGRIGRIFRGFRSRLSASLSLKLITIFISGSIVLVMLIAGLSQFGLERHVLSTARPLLVHYIHYLEADLGAPPSIERAQVLTERWPITIRIFDPSRQLRWASDGLLREPQLEKFYHASRDVRRGQVYWDRGTVLLKRSVGSSTVYYGIRLRPGGPPLIPLIFIGMVLAGLYGFYMLTKRLFAPIRAIEKGVSRIGQGQLDFRIEMNRSDELGSLAKQVNEMAGRLQGMLQARRDLLLAISHELKSPLARSRVTLALLDDSSYHQALLRDQEEMQRLIDGIIEGERQQGDFAPMHREPTDIKALVEDIVWRIQRPGEGEVQVDIQAPTLCASVDVMQIERLVRNLLENALRYNRIEMGPVRLRASIAEEVLELEVSDFGSGIEPQHLQRLTEAFYRVDASRERNTGGLGLGLYLCQAVVQAHGGKMSIHSELDKGTEVLCLIPLVAEEGIA